MVLWIANIAHGAARAGKGKLMTVLFVTDLRSTRTFSFCFEIVDEFVDEIVGEFVDEIVDEIVDEFVDEIVDEFADDFGEDFVDDLETKRKYPSTSKVH